MTKDKVLAGTSKPDATQSAPEYQLIRRAGPYETLTHTFHELGIQTNILVAAKYQQKNSDALTPTRLFKALAGVISKHPALSTIGVSQHSETKKGNHRLWEARIPHIEMRDCVRFINDVPDDDVALSQMCEAAHNQKFHTEDRSKPWWRLIVVNSSYVLFVYHHSIGDGLSGYAFHRTLLSCLEKGEEVTDLCITDGGDDISTIRPQKLPPISYPLDEIEQKLSWVRVAYHFLFWNFVRMLFKQKFFLFSDAVYPKTFPTVSKPFNNKHFTITKNRSLRIGPVAMQKLLDYCHSNGTSFTALLHTLIQITLAKDFYPEARLGFSRLAVSIRPLLRNDPGQITFMNAAGDYSRVQFLGEYRKAVTEVLTDSDNIASQVTLDTDRVWKLARKYKTSLTDYIWKSRNALQDFLIGKLLGEDEEDVGTFYGLGLYQNNSFLISNLGVFDSGPGTKNNTWSVSEVMFSSGAIRAAVGEAGIVFDIASVRNGACIICATYEEGVLRDEMVRGVLDALSTRLELMV